jgi:hypothetical protein
VATAGPTTTARTPGRIARSILAVLFGVIGVIGLLASVIGVWAHRTVFDSEKVASAVDEALLNPEVNAALATFLTDQVVDNVPVEDFVTERIPEDLEPFVPVLVGGVRQVVHEGFTRVLEDGRAREALVAVVERGHERVMQVLEGDGLTGAIRVEGEDITVNLLPLLGLGLERIQDRGVLTSVDLPELDREGDPGEQIAELEDAFGRDLPDDFGQLVVYSSERVADGQAAVARAQDAFALFKRGIVVMIVLTLACLGACVALAADRRRAAIALLLSIVATLAVGRVLVRTVVEEAPSLAAKPGGRAALDELVTSLTSGLIRLVTVGVIVAVLLAVIAYVLGNERAMTRLRGTASAGSTGARTLADEHRDATVLLSGALGLVVITLLGLTWLSIIVAGVLLGVAAWAAWAPRPEPTDGDGAAPAEMTAVGPPDAPGA